MARYLLSDKLEVDDVPRFQHSVVFMFSFFDMIGGL
jgi:hypothetical protein